MPWDKRASVSYLQSHAEASSHRRCARYVREAIERGGLRLTRTASAHDYGSSLIAAGFFEVSGSNPQRGDVVVIQPIAGHPDGHMAMFDGQIWISDFKQYHGFYPGEAYRRIRPDFKMYRRN